MPIRKGAGAGLEGGTVFLVDDQDCCTVFDEDGAFGQRIQEAELDYLVHSSAAETVLAENYVGLPF